MERRSFVKNIFGSIIGFAVFPTAIKEFAESKQKAIPVKGVYYVNTAAFRLGDIISLPNGDQYLIIDSTLDERQARSLKYGAHDITLKPIPAMQKEDKVRHICNWMPPAEISTRHSQS